MQNKTRIAFVLIGIMLLVSIYLGVSRHNTSLRFTVRGDTAFVDGETDSFSYGEAREFLNENPGVRHLILRRMAGTTDSATNMKIARLFRKKGLTTHVRRDSIIASGAVDLFISGVKRTMECGARIGVHSWSINGKIGPEALGHDNNQPVHEDFLRDMGIDPAFYVFTRESAAPDDIHIMSYDEIEKFGLLTEPAGCSN